VGLVAPPERRAGGNGCGRGATCACAVVVPGCVAARSASGGGGCGGGGRASGSAAVPSRAVRSRGDRADAGAGDRSERGDLRRGAERAHGGASTGRAGASGAGVDAERGSGLAAVGRIASGLRGPSRLGRFIRRAGGVQRARRESRRPGRGGAGGVRAGDAGLLRGDGSVAGAGPVPRPCRRRARFERRDRCERRFLANATRRDRGRGGADAAAGRQRRHDRGRGAGGVRVSHAADGGLETAGDARPGSGPAGRPLAFVDRATPRRRGSVTRGCGAGVPDVADGGRVPGLQRCWWRGRPLRSCC